MKPSRRISDLKFGDVVILNGAEESSERYMFLGLAQEPFRHEDDIGHLEFERMMGIGICLNSHTNPEYTGYAMCVTGRPLVLDEDEIEVTEVS